VGKRPYEEFFNLLRVGTLVLGQQIRPSTAAAKLVLHLVGVKQMQSLGQVRFADALALAGADALRPAEDVQEVGLERFVGPT